MAERGYPFSSGGPMKKRYPDSKQHFKGHIERAAQRYVDGVELAGIEASPTLTRAMAERAVREAVDSYEQETRETLDHNIGVILKDHNERMNEIKRCGHRMRLWTCPPIAALLGLVSWYHFASGSVMMGVLFVVGSLAFLAMMILGAIFDRPTASRPRGDQ